ncbi:MAG: hypothetical protein AB2699_19515 [Candidatus Thiodiazotropha taylori]
MTVQDQDLFTQNPVEEFRPLVDRMRPRKLAAFIGQSHIIGAGKPLQVAIEEDRLHSMILWGPLARVRPPWPV